MPVFAPLHRAAIAREALQGKPLRDQPPLDVGLKLHALHDVVKGVGVARLARSVDVQVYLAVQGGGANDTHGLRSARE